MAGPKSFQLLATMFLAQLCRCINGQNEACKIDLVFVVDSSGSICDDDPSFDKPGNICNNWVSMRNFLCAVTNKLPIGMNHTRVGMVTFRDEYKVRWLLNGYSDRSSLCGAIKALPYKPFGLTYMGDALCAMRTEVFTKEGDRPDAANVGILVSDANPTPGQEQRVKDCVGLIDSDLITMFSVGITKKINETVLKFVSTGEVKDADYFMSLNFVEMNEQIKELKSSACNAPVKPPKIQLSTRPVHTSQKTTENRAVSSTSTQISGINLVTTTKPISSPSASNITTNTRFTTTSTATTTYRTSRNIAGMHPGITTKLTTGRVMTPATTTRRNVSGPPTSSTVVNIITGTRAINRTSSTISGRPTDTPHELVKTPVRGPNTSSSSSTTSGIHSLNPTPTVSTIGHNGKTTFTVTTTLAGPVSTTQDITGCSAIDLVIALDASGSIEAANFQQMRQFAKQLIAKIQIGPHARFGLATYGSTAKVECSLNEISTMADALLCIDNSMYTGGKTNTADAIRTMTEMFEGDVRRPRVGVLVTDGQSDDHGQTWQEALAAREAGIHLIAVGMGVWVRFEELRAIASYPAENNVFQVQGFWSMTDATESINNAICNKVDDCRSSPCENGGSCVDVIGGYYCICSQFYSGKYCNMACRGEADVLFIIDVSGSIQHERFYLVQEFVVEVASHLETWNDKVRIGIVYFSDHPTLDFHLNVYSRQEDIQQSVRFIKYNGGRTNLAGALEMAREEIFVESNGDRLDVPNYTIVFTDGGANIRVTETMVEAAKLKNADVHVVVVSVGRDMQFTTLRGIASWPWQRNLVEINSYLKILELVKPTIDTMCNAKDECLTNPCQGGGTCVDSLGEYICLCPSDRTGRNCQSTCDKRYDIAFVTDAGSMFSSLHDYIIPWMRQVVYGLQYRSDTVRSALISYTDKAYAHFFLNSYSTQAEVLEAVSTFSIRGGQTNVQVALDRVRADVFNSGNGDRPDAENIVVILSDGGSNLNRAQTKPAAERLKADGALVFTVGFGEFVDNAEMSELATNATKPYVMNVESKADIATTAKAFLGRLCT